MGSPLVNLASSAPGLYGLNKQQSGDVLPPGWATEAKNAVFDTIGRLAARKGTKNTAVTGFTGNPGSAHEYIDGDGNRVTIFGADNKLYKVAGTAYTDISGSITTPTGDDWQFANFNGKCVAFQNGHTPIVVQTTAGNFADLSGTNIPTNADNVLSAFGRLWVIDGTLLKYSQLLDETDFGAGPNSLDLATVFWRGMDEGVVCIEWNGFLCVFGRRSIAIYQGAVDPAGTGFGLVDNISDIGCVARDSIQTIGTDALFLSLTGVRSLQRTIQEKSNPLNDISMNNRDYILSFYSEGIAIKSAYCELERIYLLSIPSVNKVFCFETRSPLQDGSLRMTEWDVTHYCYSATFDSTLYIGVATYLATYTGYLDGVLSDGTGGSSYPWVFEGPWNDFGEQVENRLKIPKKGSLHFFGAVNGNIKYKWAFDYETFFRTNVLFISNEAGSEYNVADTEYGEDEYAGTSFFNELPTNLSGTGRLVKFGAELDINTAFALQRQDMQAKIGKQLV